MKIKIAHFCFGILLLSLNACKSETAKNQKLFTLLQADYTGVRFENKVTETQEFNAITYRNFYNGGGVAVGDVNNDGLPDLYFTSNQASNKLYINKGNFQFEDITDAAGVGGTRAWSTGVSMVDINDDGYLDIYVCNSGDIDGENKANELFINQGTAAADGQITFKEEAVKYNLANEGYTTHAAFLDYDIDGDLDCYILNNSFKDPSKIELYRSMRDIPDELGGDRLMRNDGGIFTDVSKEAGIYGSEIGFGLGVATGDLNNDNLPDLYISNDFWERDYLYLNNGDGTFKEDLINRIDYTSVSSMGADIADINGDGSPDIFTTDMLAADNYRIAAMVNFDPYHLEDLKYRANYHYQFIQNCLQINDGNAHFQEIGMMAGVAATDWSWGALLFDFENDGTQDIFVANGIYKDLMSGDFRDFMAQSGISSKSKSEIDFLSLTKQMPSNPLKNAAFLNQNNFKFSNSSDSLGFESPSFSNGSVYSDLDNDGDLDLVINNVNSPSFIYRNNSTEITSNNYLKVDFIGPKGNGKGIGAKVELTSQSGTKILENYMNRGFESSIEPILHFGLGSSKTITKLRVTWPNGNTETIQNPQVNQKVTLDFKNASPVGEPKKSNEIAWFTDVTSKSISGNISHKENAYNDFDQENLLHRMLSTESPRIVVGDVNDDQKEDFIMLGSSGDSDKLFIQQADGSFKPSNLEVFGNDKNFESTCGAFLDFDMDGDQDLLIGSGGNQVNMEQVNYIVRLYVNDGKGNFQVDPNSIPPVVGNYSTLEVCDFDYDGDKDVFLGARAVPGNYGLVPRSTLLRNDRGSWADITSDALGGLGMVTDATFADFDKDGYEDLIVVGDWMAIQVFQNVKGRFSTSTPIPNSEGWWTRIEASDLDGDGYVDFVVGNWGLNSKFQASLKNPLTMYTADFDNNGKSEFVINWKAPLNDISYPFATKMELTSQMPSLKRKNLKYDQFARMSYEELFDVEIQGTALSYSANTLESSILWNQKGALSLEKLPQETQVSPVFGIIAQDFNGDGISDLWLGGNFYGLKPQVGRQNSNKGILLQGLGNRKFKSVPFAANLLNGEVRDAVWINKQMVIARNNETLKIFARP